MSFYIYDFPLKIIKKSISPYPILVLKSNAMTVPEIFLLVFGIYSVYYLTLMLFDLKKSRKIASHSDNSHNFQFLDPFSGQLRPTALPSLSEKNPVTHQVLLGDYSKSMSEDSDLNIDAISDKDIEVTGENLHHYFKDKEGR
jgi:hypothetical protein